MQCIVELEIAEKTLDWNHLQVIIVQSDRAVFKGQCSCLQELVHEWTQELPSQTENNLKALK